MQAGETLIGRSIPTSVSYGFLVISSACRWGEGLPGLESDRGLVHSCVMKGRTSVLLLSGAMKTGSASANLAGSPRTRAGSGALGADERNATMGTATIHQR
jgi:hypothetical protein